MSDPSKSKNYRQRHRLEHFSFDTGESQYRQVDNHDDRDRKDHRSSHLHAGFKNGPLRRFIDSCVLRLCASSHSVFDHHDRAIDD